MDFETASIDLPDNSVSLMMFFLYKPEILTRQLNSSFRPQRSGEPESRKVVGIAELSPSRELPDSGYQLLYISAMLITWNIYAISCCRISNNLIFTKP